MDLQSLIPECSICFDKFSESNPPWRYACGHIFHQSCSNGWLNQQRICAVCRAPVKEVTKDFILSAMIEKLATLKFSTPPESDPPTTTTTNSGSFSSTSSLNLGGGDHSLVSANLVSIFSIPPAANEQYIHPFLGILTATRSISLAVNVTHWSCTLCRSLCDLSQHAFETHSKELVCNCSRFQPKHPLHSQHELYLCRSSRALLCGSCGTTVHSNTLAFCCSTCPVITPFSLCMPCFGKSMNSMTNNFGNYLERNQTRDIYLKASQHNSSHNFFRVLSIATNNNINNNNNNNGSGVNCGLCHKFYPESCADAIYRCRSCAIPFYVCEHCIVGVKSSIHNSHTLFLSRAKLSYNSDGRWICDECGVHFDDKTHNYHCSACKYDLCLECLKKSSKHPHRLQQRSASAIYKSKGWICDICNQKFTDDTQMPKHCEICQNFDSCDSCIRKGMATKS